MSEHVEIKKKETENVEYEFDDENLKDWKKQKYCYVADGRFGSVMGQEATVLFDDGKDYRLEDKQPYTSKSRGTVKELMNYGDFVYERRDGREVWSPNKPKLN